MKRIHFQIFSTWKKLIFIKIELSFKAYYYIYKQFNKIRTVTCDDIRLCCLFWGFVRHNIDCTSNVRYFFTCDNLINSLNEKNLLLTIMFMWSSRKCIHTALVSKNFNQKYYVILVMSHFLVSIYILSIIITDSHYENDCLQKYYIWLISTFCHLLGLTINWGHWTINCLTSLFKELKNLIIWIENSLFLAQFLFNPN